MKTSTLFASALAAITVAAAPTQEAPHPVTQAQYDAIKRAAGFASAAYMAPPCASPMNTTVLVSISGPATGFVSRDDANKQIIVAMRGSATVEDFDVDSDAIKVPYDMAGSEGCGPDCKLHEGFLQVSQYAWPFISKAVDAAKVANPDYKIMVTGHSLAGAECTLLSLPLRRKYKDDVTAYCMASPRFVTPTMAKFMESFWAPGTFYRVTAEDDGVPRVLTEALGFHHVGVEYWAKKYPALGPEDILDCIVDDGTACNGQYGESFDTFGVNDAHLHYIVSFVDLNCNGGFLGDQPHDITEFDNESGKSRQ